MVCPECGKPLTMVKPPPSKLWGLIPWLVLIIILAAVVWVGLPYASQWIAKLQKPTTSGEAETDSGDPAATPVPHPTGGTPKVTAASPTPSEPPLTVIVPEHIETSLSKAENQKARDEVLKRIDLMPTISDTNKDKLYNSVERARSMGLVLTIPFPSGKNIIGPTELQQLKSELDRPEMKKLRDDPTAVFVILGYADPKGDEKKNLDISQKRADSVLDAMRDKCGVANVMHSVAMGGQKLIDAKNLEKNRVVEVWVAQP